MYVCMCMYACMAAWLHVCMCVCVYVYVCVPYVGKYYRVKIFARITIEEANDGKEYFDEFDSRSSVASLRL